MWTSRICRTVSLCHFFWPTQRKKMDKPHASKGEQELEENLDQRFIKTNGKKRRKLCANNKQVGTAVEIGSAESSAVEVRDPQEHGGVISSRIAYSNQGRTFKEYFKLNLYTINFTRNLIIPEFAGCPNWAKQFLHVEYQVSLRTQCFQTIR